MAYVSEKSGWRHVYLIDANLGSVRNAVTSGDWVVRGIDEVDEVNRQLWFRASGCFPGQDPYLIHYGRVNFDGTGLVWLTESNGNHTLQFSPDKKFAIDSYSRVDLAPVTELRRVADGKLVCELQRSDVDGLRATGTHYSDSSNIDNAHLLQGKLLLIVGEMDTNVPPESTMRFADKLIKANKDFDLLVIPNASHGMGGAYGQRKMHDFFVRNFLAKTATN